MSRIVRRVLVLSLVTLVVPAAAVAADGSTTTPTGVGTTPGAVEVNPNPGSIKLHVPDAFAIHRRLVSVPRRGVHIDGVVRPYVAGQWVTVRTYLGHRLIKRDRLRVRPSPGGKAGRFSERVASPRVGRVAVTATHERTAAQVAFRATRRFAALSEHVGFGSRGRFVQLIQGRLAALHFWIPQSGVYDSGTGLAIDAYHRLLGWGHSQTLDGRTISFLLNGWGAFSVRYPRHGRHAEGNLGKQLLALIDGSRVNYIFPISSGKPSTPTVLGDFHVYSRVAGYLPDGMFYSNFFTGGYAIHGYDPAPDYPASHGCMRLPVDDAIPVFDWLAYGDWVDVYY